MQNTKVIIQRDTVNFTPCYKESINQILIESSIWNKKNHKRQIKMVAPICGWIYKEVEYTLIPWSGIYPDS